MGAGVAVPSGAAVPGGADWGAGVIPGDWAHAGETRDRVVNAAKTGVRKGRLECLGRMDLHSTQES